MRPRLSFKLYYRQLYSALYYSKALYYAYRLLNVPCIPSDYTGGGGGGWGEVYIHRISHTDSNQISFNLGNFPQTPTLKSYSKAVEFRLVEYF